MTPDPHRGRGLNMAPEVLQLRTLIGSATYLRTYWNPCMWYGMGLTCKYKVPILKQSQTEELTIIWDWYVTVKYHSPDKCYAKYLELQKIFSNPKETRESKYGTVVGIIIQKIILFLEQYSTINFLQLQIFAVFQ